LRPMSIAALDRRSDWSPGSQLDVSPVPPT
jgi:hypothetical protein